MAAEIQLYITEKMTNYIKIESSYFKLKWYFTILLFSFYCIFNQIYVVLVSKKKLSINFSDHKLMSSSVLRN